MIAARFSSEIHPAIAYWLANSMVFFSASIFGPARKLHLPSLVATRMARILIIEDQPDIRNVLKLALVDRGYEVNAWPDGESALSEIDTQWPDVAIVDSTLPGMNGLEVGRAIIERTGERAPVLLALFTGYHSAEMEQKSRAEGFDLFLRKPISISDLCAKLAQLCNESDG